MNELDERLSEGGEEGSPSEQEARKEGWVPQEEWRGPPEEWVDASTFVKRGREILPIVKRTNERLERELRAAQEQVRKLEGTVAEMGSQFAKMQEKAYARAILDVKAQMRSARSEGDEETAEALADQLETLKEEQKGLKAPSKPANGGLDEATKAERARILSEWVRENPWYEKDKSLHYLAEGLATEVAREMPWLVGKREFLDVLAERVRSEAPEKFRNPRRAEGSPVEGSSRAGSTQAGSRSAAFSKLPAEAKEVCDMLWKDFVQKEGSYKSLDEWRARYAEDYGG